MDDQTIKSISHQLHVGDILELTILEDEGENYGDNFSSQIIEIPVSCKHLTKDGLYVYFALHKFDIDIEPTNEDPNDNFMEIVITRMEIHEREALNGGIGILVFEFDASGETAIGDRGVRWKKIASAR